MQLLREAYRPSVGHSRDPLRDPRTFQLGRADIYTVQEAHEVKQPNSSHT